MSSTSRGAGLTVDRASEIYHGRGEPPSGVELDEYAKVQALSAAVATKLLPELQKAGQEAAAASEIVECSLHEVVETHGSEYGELTAGDVLEQGERGFRGREALDAALRARRGYGRDLWRDVARSRFLTVSRCRHAVRPVRRALPSGRPSRSRRAATSSRGSPRSSDPPDPPPDVVVLGVRA